MIRIRMARNVLENFETATILPTGFDAMPKERNASHSH